jgi:antibiotic biosynthesis monooxygenase (ABM) superfamily enzyme
LIAGLGYLVYTTPKVEDHKVFLLAELQQTYPVSEEMQAQIWKEVDYSNFFVCSFMKTSVGSTMITYGFLKKVKLIDSEWIDKVKTKLQRQAEAY